MKGRLLIFLSVSFCISFLSHAQQDTLTTLTRKIKKNGVFIEVAGKAYAYSVNYERYISCFKKVKTSLQIGGGYGNYNIGEMLAIPYGINFLIGKKRGHFEIGLAQTFTNYTKKKYNTIEVQPHVYQSILISKEQYIYLANSISFGYKRLPMKGEGFFISAYGMIWLPNIAISSPNNEIKPFLNLAEDYYYIMPYLGFNIGYMF